MTSPVGKKTYTQLDHPSPAYVVIDLEWNQPIPWIKSDVDPKELPGEIIEIGAVKLTLGEDGYELSKPFHIAIRPVCYKVMNKNVSRVTNKISSDLRFGVPFATAYAAFLSWVGTDYVLCGWGNSDLTILKSNLHFHGLNERVGALFLDVQPLFARVAEGVSLQRSVEYAVDFLHIPKNDDFHSAHRDAEYTGRILEAILRMLDQPDVSDDIRISPPTRGEPEAIRTLRISHYLQNPDLKVERVTRTDLFSTWEACFSAYPKEKEKCPACGRLLSECIPWFRLKKSGFSTWYCEDHHMVLGRMRMKKTPDGKFYASVLLRLTDPGSARLVAERYEEYLEFGPKGKPIEIPAEMKADAVDEVRDSGEEGASTAEV